VYVFTKSQSTRLAALSMRIANSHLFSISKPQDTGIQALRFNRWNRRGPACLAPSRSSPRPTNRIPPEIHHVRGDLRQVDPDYTEFTGPLLGDVEALGCGDPLRVAQASNVQHDLGAVVGRRGVYVSRSSAARRFRRVLLFTPVLLVITASPLSALGAPSDAVPS
jgi:hypothetical protein